MYAVITYHPVIASNYVVRSTHRSVTAARREFRALAGAYKRQGGYAPGLRIVEVDQAAKGETWDQHDERADVSVNPDA